MVAPTGKLRMLQPTGKEDNLVAGEIRHAGEELAGTTKETEFYRFRCPGSTFRAIENLQHFYVLRIPMNGHFGQFISPRRELSGRIR